MPSRALAQDTKIPLNERDLSNIPVEDMTAHERVLYEAQKNQIVTLDGMSPADRLRKKGLPALNLNETLKTFCQREARRIDAVDPRRELYLMDDVTYFQCQEVITFYCLEYSFPDQCIDYAQKEKELIEEAEKTGEPPACAAFVVRNREACDTFPGYVDAAFAPFEIEAQRRILRENTRKRYAE